MWEKIWRFLLKPLGNERGELGGDYTDAELVILGEKEAPEETSTATQTETQDPAIQTATAAETVQEEQLSSDENKAAETAGYKLEKDKGRTYLVDDQGTRIPVTRWKKHYAETQAHIETATQEAQTSKRKLNLIKELGPDKFYELHPEERPEGWKPPAPKAPARATIPAEQYGNLTYGNKDPNHPWNGLTLREIHEQDPIAAKALLDQYIANEAASVRSEQEQQEKWRKDSETEINTFSDVRAKEMFGKELGKCSAEEQEKVKGVIASTLDWMTKTKRGAGNIEDAYFLMNKDTILESERTKGSKAALESLNKPGVPSISAGKGSQAVVSTDVSAMTTAQLSNHIYGLPESKMMEFLRTAPAELKAKHPTLPWD
jgi:hypothetical protein